jgi:hypothetical protein
MKDGKSGGPASEPPNEQLHKKDGSALVHCRRSSIGDEC